MLGVCSFPRNYVWEREARICITITTITLSIIIYFSDQPAITNNLITMLKRLIMFTELTTGCQGHHQHRWPWSIIGSELNWILHQVVSRNGTDLVTRISWLFLVKIRNLIYCYITSTMKGVTVTMYVHDGERCYKSVSTI